MVSTDNEFTQFLKYKHLNGSPQEEFSEEYKTKQVERLKKEFIMFSAGSTIALLAAAKAFKPPS
jgi:hypothetical protein